MVENVTVVVGASGKIGSHLAKVLVETNAEKVIGIDISSARTTHKNYSHFHADISRKSDFADVVNHLEVNRLGIRNLVLAAALDSVPNKDKASDYDRGIELQDIEETRKRVDINVTSQLLCISLFHKYLQSNSHVLLFSSIYGLVSPDHRVYPHGFIKPIEYSASKAAILGITRHLAVTLATETKGRVNCLCLGGIADTTHLDEFRKNYLERVPLKRFCSLEDVSNAALFLMSDTSSYITGASLNVDGGYTCL